jgi:predicted metal-dependent peptidase
MGDYAIQDLIRIENEKILECSNGLIFQYPYYSEILLSTNITETVEVPTMGVNTSFKGFNLYYNKDFTNKLKQSEVNFVIIHEIFHLIFDHYARTTKEYDRELSNVAQDMIINNIIVNEIVRRTRSGNFSVTIPTDKKGNNSCLFIPKEYEGHRTFEYLYDWLLEKQKENQKQEGNQDGESQDGKSNYGKNGADDIDCYDLKSVFDNMEKGEQVTIDKHLEDSIPQELKRQMVKDILDKIKARGLSDGDFETILGQLRKPKKDYLKSIKKGISHLKGQLKSKTWSKGNRKNLPLKGFKKYSTKINVVLDTSGSMSGYFEKILSYVFQNDIEINMIQCDTRIHDMGCIKTKSQFKKLIIKGLGGTLLQPSIDYIAEKYNKFATVILTDGYCDSLNITALKNRVLIISNGVECKVETNGKFQQIIVENEG